MHSNAQQGGSGRAGGGQPVRAYYKPQHRRLGGNGVCGCGAGDVAIARATASAARGGEANGNRRAEDMLRWCLFICTTDADGGDHEL